MPPFMGNAAIGRLLAECRRRDTLHHAYTFAGPDGVGKKRLALQLAKSLNCAAAPAGLDACDACISCRKVDSGSHPDVQVIAPETKVFKIDQVRALIQEIYYLPFEGRRRVFILDDADRMNEEAANSLLKTLEEPSAVNVFILVSSRPHLLPMTILSRCHRLRFNPVPRDVIASFLEREHALAPDKALILASSSGGSIGRALNLHRGDYIALRDGILERVAKGSLDPMSCLALAGRLAGEKEDILEALDILTIWYRDLLVFRETGRTAALINHDRAGDIGRLALAMSGESLLGAFRAIRSAAEAIERNANKPLTLETMVFTLFADKANFVEDSRRRPRAAGPGR